MSSKANSKTYETINRKNGKQQDSDANTNSTSLSHKPAPPRSSLSDDYSLIASEVARHINPEFSKSCQSRANLHIHFSLMYPAKLKIFLPSGVRVFSDPGEAHIFTSHLERNNSGNLAPGTTLSNSKIGSPPKYQRWKRYDMSRQSRLSNDTKSSQVQTKSRSRSPLPPRAGSLPHSSEDNMIPDT
ncbi:hypothetical protein XELAEV_18006036mg [Xenopus laevis]|uniref:Uncharacterized protein n=1 Tax=Xenopus laevis TaxID=8355 RepID=A0A974DY57_XENLA|nr:hypothetical protein XELAEV_18006036mg [Xenopus laevis]